MDYPKLSMKVRKGSTENIPIRMESAVWTYAAIENLSQSAPVRIKSTGHAIPEGWRVAVMNVVRPKDLNSEHNPPWDEDMRVVTVVDPDHIEFNEINGSAFQGFSRSGELAWRLPVDLTQYASARMTVRASVGGSLIASWNTTSGHLQIDATQQAVWVRLAHTDTEALPVGRFVFDVELVRTTGEVERVCVAESDFTVLPENTTE